nr:unnamed protein product [Callosobruchus chinensis]
MTLCHRMDRAMLPRHCVYQRVLLLLSYVHLHHVPAAPL